MDGLGVTLVAIAWWVGVPIVVVGAAIALGFDWKKPSNYGLTKAGPPPLLLLVFVIVGLALIVLASPRG